jgi:hypothetical protein
LDDWFDVQALNTATGAVSSAAATVTCFNMTAAYPEPPSVNRATRVYPPAKQDDGTTNRPVSQQFCSNRRPSA